MADVSVTDFQEQFPAFETDAGKIERAIKEARELTCIIPLATLYCAAHLILLNRDVAIGAERPGELTENKVGPITTKHKAQAMTARQAFFTRTEYGRRVLALESRSVKAVVGIAIR